MSRYRALTMRWPHLTEAEEAERRQLALAGWHEALGAEPYVDDDDDDLLQVGDVVTCTPDLLAAE